MDPGSSGGNLTTIMGVFYGADFTTLDLTHWDVSKVTNFSGAFAFSDVTSLDISNWDTGSATVMSNMFRQ